LANPNKPEHYKADYLQEKKARKELEMLLEKQNAALKQSEEKFTQAMHKLHHTQNKLKKLTYFDSLTHLPNRAQFDADLERELTRTTRFNRSLAILYLDIDFLKRINDSYGHEVGNLLLIEAAVRLNKVIRIEDFVARLGGDEFGIILSEIENIPEIGHIAERIIEEFNKPFLLAGHMARVSVSIGIAYYPDTGETGNELHKNAGIALYSAKELGRNNYQYFTEALLKRYMHHLALETDMHFALEREEFYLVYQPRFDLQTKQMVGIETFIRWEHPTQGYISPTQLISIAEETGIIIPMGEWVLETACHQFSKWRAMNPRLKCSLSLNVSARQFYHKNFTQKVKKALLTSEIPAQLLEIEITETVIKRFLGAVQDSLSELRQLGVQFSGIETEAPLQFLIKNKCPQVPNYYYSQPLTVEEMDKFIASLAISD
jgi:diguanylate cyclase